MKIVIFTKTPMEKKPNSNLSAKSSFLRKQSITSSGKTTFSQGLDGYYIRKNTGNKIAKKLSLPDIFGSTVDFTVDGNDTFNTKVGFFVSLLTICFAISILVYYIMKFVDNSNEVEVMIHDSYLSEPVSFDSSLNAFFLRLTLWDSDVLQEFIDVRNYFDLYFTTTTLTQAAGSYIAWDSTETRLDKSLGKCSDLDTSNFTNQTVIRGWYSEAGKDSFDTAVACSNPSEGYLSSGNRASTTSTFFSLNVGPCNEKSNQLCDFEANIKNYTKFQFVVELVNIFYDVANYTEPIRYALTENIDMHVNVDISKVYNIFFKQVTVNTNYNRIFGNLGWEESITYQTFDYMTTDDMSRAQYSKKQV